YKPAVFSSTYSRILVRARGGNSGAASMRLMIDAERPEALWLALRTVQAVLRESPSALACSSSVRNPADLTASASSLILEDCRAFILEVSGSGGWIRACTRAAEDANVGAVVVVIAAPQSLLCSQPVNLQWRAPAARWSFCERDAVPLANDLRSAHLSFDVRTH